MSVVSSEVSRQKGRISVTFRVTKEVVEKFEEYIFDNHLDRNEMATLILAKYITERGVEADKENEHA